jgi:hypothetical protein
MVAAGVVAFAEPGSMTNLEGQAAGRALIDVALLKLVDALDLEQAPQRIIAYAEAVNAAIAAAHYAGPEVDE